MISKINQLDPDTPLRKIMEDIPTSNRLISRKPFYRVPISNQGLADRWRARWLGCVPEGGEVVVNPTEPVPGYEGCSRRLWVTRNRLLTRHGRTRARLCRWGNIEDPICTRCGLEPETTDHIVLHCPHTAIDGGYETLYLCGDAFASWMRNLDLRV